jgi:hypothetical protein
MSHPNSAVLNALTKLTGENFGYDAAAWKAWAAESLKIDALPPKRVPTP